MLNLKAKSTLIISGLLLAAASLAQTPIKTMNKVNLKKYLGRWYEIARLPNRYQEGCDCAQAVYSYRANGFNIINWCNTDGKWKNVTGKAWVDDNSNSRLTTQYYWPITGNYLILYVSPDYQYVVVGTLSRNYLWISARKPKISQAEYQKLVAVAQKQGYDTSKLVKTPQICWEKKKLTAS